MSLGMLTISGNFDSDDITSVKPLPIMFGKNVIAFEERTRLQALDSGGSLTAITFPNGCKGKRGAINEAGEGGPSKKPVCANDTAEEDIEDDNLRMRDLPTLEFQSPTTNVSMIEVLGFVIRSYRTMLWVVCRMSIFQEHTFTPQSIFTFRTSWSRRSPLSRKPFHRKQKERAGAEPLKDWEVLDRTDSSHSSLEDSTSHPSPPSPLLH
ncbi:hypothetical protein BD769DRAFT_1775734 [Suillus cothurnatus]|nr:hypothetical protein BD769DRAFT_1775734 [Suillus cothurnatus]